MSVFRLGDWTPDSRVLIVAEVGNNHEGNPDLAEELVGLAARAGADAVKFQTMAPEGLVVSSEVERRAQLEKFRLPDEVWPRLKRAADAAGVLFLSTPFDLEAVALLEPLVPAFKIASGDNDVVPLLRAIAQTGKPIMLSTGLADEPAVRGSVAVVESVWGRMGARGGLALLHCVSSYPAPLTDAALGSMAALRPLADVVGYSDHTLGTDAALLAVALGARIVEKHFTLRKDFSAFRDHAMSADPEELGDLVRRVRAAEQALRPAEGRPLAIEEPIAKVARRALRAKTALPAGHRLGEEDVSWLRPAGEIAVAEFDRVMGRVLRRSLAEDELLAWEDLD